METLEVAERLSLWKGISWLVQTLGSVVTYWHDCFLTWEILRFVALTHFSTRSNNWTDTNYTPSLEIFLIKCSTCFWLFCLKKIRKKDQHPSDWKFIKVSQCFNPLSPWVDVPPCLFRGSKRSPRRGSSAHRNEEMGKSLKGHKGAVYREEYLPGN